MQIGMIGLGRMGGNIVRRLTRNGHQCVVFDQNPAAIKALVGEHVAGSADLKQLVGQLKKPRAVWVMLPAGQITEETVEHLGGLLEPDDIIIDGGNSFYKDDIRRAKNACREGHSLRRLRHLRRRLGHRARLLHDDRRPEGGGGSPRSDLLGARSRARRYPAHAGPRERRSPRRARLHPRRPVRRRALRQDGAQRHRVRIDAGLRRGLRHPAQQGLEGSARGRALHAEHAGYRGGLAARQRHLILAARSRRRRAGEGSAVEGFLRLRPGFGRGPLDHRGRDRGGGSGRRAVRRRCSPASARGRSTPSAKRCSRPCASASADTSRARSPSIRNRSRRVNRRRSTPPSSNHARQTSDPDAEDRAGDRVPAAAPGQASRSLRHGDLRRHRRPDQAPGGAGALQPCAHQGAAGEIRADRRGPLGAEPRKAGATSFTTC